MYITYSQKCVFSRNHTIKKKKRQKKGVESGFPQLFNPKNHKSQPNVIQARTTRPAEITSPEPSAAPPLPAEPEAGIERKQTGFKIQNAENSGVWKKQKKKLFGEILVVLEFLRMVCFSTFFQTSDCVWLWLYLVVFVSTVGGLTMFLCSFNRPTPPTWPPSSLAIWPPSSLGWKPAVINDPFGWRRTEVNNGE